MTLDQFRQNYNLKFSGNGTMPNVFTFVSDSRTYLDLLGPTGPTRTDWTDTDLLDRQAYIGPVKYLYNLPMTDLTNISQVTSTGFEYQWSYDQQVGYSDINPNPNYFALNQPNGLEINIYTTDKPFQSGSSTEPRTELRGTQIILDKVEYTIQFDQFLVVEPTFDFCWLQIFGNRISEFIVRWRSGQYELLSDAGSHIVAPFTDTSITPASDTGVWTNWKMVFYLDTASGYTQIYRNGILMCSTSGINNSGGNNSYLKHGVYSQQMKPSNNVTTYTKNLFLYY